MTKLRQMDGENSRISDSRQFALGLCFLWEGIFPLGDVSNLPGHEGQVAQGLDAHIGVQDFPQPLSLPDVKGHHGGCVILDPQHVPGLTVHGHHQPVPVGHKVGHFCNARTCGDYLDSAALIMHRNSSAHSHHHTFPCTAAEQQSRGQNWADTSPAAVQECCNQVVHHSSGLLPLLPFLIDFKESHLQELHSPGFNLPEAT